MNVLAYELRALRAIFVVLIKKIDRYLHIRENHEPIQVEFTIGPVKDVRTK